MPRKHSALPGGSVGVLRSVVMTFTGGTPGIEDIHFDLSRPPAHDARGRDHPRRTDSAAIPPSGKTRWSRPRRAKLFATRSFTQGPSLPNRTAEFGSRR